ncbi:MAG: PKD domain-containing protein [Candidatus Kapabacteria bacterium]|nr:PKD domain-containing protein [Candidatus Kapabacteria bacterium]
MTPTRHLTFRPLLALLMAAFACGSATAQTPETAQQQTRELVAARLPDLPLGFRQNNGQWDPATLYHATTATAQAAFGRDGVGFLFTRPSSSQTPSTSHSTARHTPPTVEVLQWGIHFSGALPNPRIQAEEPLPGRANYFHAGRAIAGVREHGRLWYRDLYPNIDLCYYGTGRSLKYDCVVRPGGQLRDVRMECTGINQLAINNAGQLEIATSWGTLIEQRPYAYQIIDGKQVEVPTRFILWNDTTYGFATDHSYRRDLPLVIDPTMLAWSTFIGGSSTTEGYLVEGYMRDIDVDALGYIYGVGWYSDYFPTVPGSYNELFNGGDRGTTMAPEDAYVFKMTPDGRSLVYSTYLGGSRQDEASSINVNSSGEAYVVGYTFSRDFPVTLDPTPIQDYNAGLWDGFAVKLSRDGDSLIYSTYFGSDSSDFFDRAALNSRGELSITGNTTSPNYPTTPGAYSTTNSGPLGTADALVTVLDADAQTILYSTLVGGNDHEAGLDIVLNNADEAFVLGTTYSADFPTTTGAFQEIPAGNADAFLLQLSRDGSQLLASTYFGGAGTDIGEGIVLNSAGDPVIVGITYSPDLFTTPGAFDRSFNTRPGNPATSDAYVASFRADLTGVNFCTYLGGTNNDRANTLALDQSENIFVVGSTFASGNFEPTFFPISSCAYDQLNRGGFDLFLTKLSPTASRVMYSTMIGGVNNDYGSLDNYGRARIRLMGDSCNVEAVIGMTTHSPNFPTTPGAFQPRKGNEVDNGLEDQPVLLKFKPYQLLQFRYDTTSCGVVQFHDGSELCIWDDGAPITKERFWDFGDGGSSTEQNPRHRYATPGNYTVRLYAGCPRDSLVMEITVPPFRPIPVGAGEDQYICSGASAQLQATGGTLFTWEPSTGLNCTSCPNPIAQPTATTTYRVTITDGYGCTGTDTVTVFVTARPAIVASPDTAICAGGAAQLQATGGVAYTWRPATGLSCITCPNPIARPTATTTYIVTGQGDPACRETAEDTVVVRVVPPPAVRLTRDTSICAGGIVQLSAIADSAGVPRPMRFRWVPSSGLDCDTCATVQATPTATTTWKVIATNAAGCSDSASVTVSIVPPRGIEAPSVRAICVGDSVQLSVGGNGPVEWSPATGLSCTDCPAPWASPSSTQVYTVRSLLPCGGSDTVTVAVLPLPTVAVVPDTLFCSGQLTATASPNTVAYRWTPPDGLSCDDCPAPFANPSATTRYHLTITDANGCVARDSALVIVNPRTVRLHIGKEYQVGIGNTVVVEVMADSAMDPLGLTSIAIKLSYDPTFLRANAALLEGRILDGWKIDSVQQNRSEGWAIYFLSSPTGSPAVGSGALLGIQLIGYLGANSSSPLPFSILSPMGDCLSVVTDPGAVRIDSICGLNLRLIELTTADYALDQNRPNPFNPLTDITFSLGLDGPTRLEVLDGVGQRVALLLNERLAAGRYTVTWDATAHPSGLYYYRLTSGDWTMTRAMMVVK